MEKYLEIDELNTVLSTCSPKFTEDVSDQELEWVYSTINLVKAEQIDLTKLGTSFDMLVWSGIQQIPFGETRTYKELALQIGKPTSHRAIANACGRNKLFLLIPCHRVVGTNNLGGFKWGIELKKRLLDFERT